MAEEFMWNLEVALDVEKYGSTIEISTRILTIRVRVPDEELHILYSSPKIIRQIKSWRMEWAGHVARVGEESVQGFGGNARRKETTWKTKT
jgi:hypothetical protein